MFTLVFCLQTIKRNQPAPHSDAFIVDFTREVNCTQLYNNFRPITTVQYHRILYGHIVGMMRCDWSFTVGYIITNYIAHLFPTWTTISSVLSSISMSFMANTSDIEKYQIQPRYSSHIYIFKNATPFQ